MPQVTINVITTPEEQEKVYQAIKEIIAKEDCSKGMPISKIAKKAGMNQNRVRYVVADLVDNGRVEKVTVKAYNERYVRYSYIPRQSDPIGREISNAN